MNLENVVQQQNEFIEQNENELQRKSQAESEIERLHKKITEISNEKSNDLNDKTIQIDKLTEQLNFKRYYSMYVQVTIVLLMHSGRH